jgi:hypothetical protein
MSRGANIRNILMSSPQTLGRFAVKTGKASESFEKELKASQLMAKHVRHTVKIFGKCRFGGPALVMELVDYFRDEGALEDELETFAPHLPLSDDVRRNIASHLLRQATEFVVDILFAKQPKDDTRHLRWQTPDHYWGKNNFIRINKPTSEWSSLESIDQLLSFTEAVWFDFGMEYEERQLETPSGALFYDDTDHSSLANELFKLLWRKYAKNGFFFKAKLSKAHVWQILGEEVGKKLKELESSSDEPNEEQLSIKHALLDQMKVEFENPNLKFEDGQPVKMPDVLAQFIYTIEAPQ